MSYMLQIATLPKTEVSAPVVGGFLSADELKNVSQAEIDSYVTGFINKWDLTGFDWEKAKDLFSYEGFDPKEVYKHILAVQKKLNMKDEDRDNDIGLLLVLQHLKGNITAGNFKTLKPEAQNMVNMLFSRWQVQTDKNSNKKLAFTISRLAAALPLQLAFIGEKVPKDFAGPFDSKELPNCMKTSSFPALVPIGMKMSKMICVAYNCYATDQMLAIKKANYMAMTEDEKKKKFEEQLKFSDVSFQSTVLTSDCRRGAMITLGLEDKYPVVLKIASKSHVTSDNYCSQAEWNADFKTIKDAIATKASTGPI